MRKWCKSHPVLFMAFYAVFYLSCFAFLEKHVLVPDLWVHCSLDNLIPFCKYAIIPYVMWFPWIPFTLFYILRHAPRADFWRLCLPLFAGMTLSLLFYVMVPNGLSLRPHSVPGNDIFAEAVRMLYRSDTPTNVCPSIHVFNSVTLDMAFQRSTLLAKPKYRLVRWGAHLLDVSIVLSTMLLKQHSVIDVVCGIVLAIVLDRAATAVSVMLERRPAVLAPAAEQPHAALEHE